MQNGNLHVPKKFGLHQCAVDLYLLRWIKDAEWKFTFTEEVWIIQTYGGFVPMKMNKRCRMVIYIYRKIRIIPTCVGFVPREMNKRCRMEIYISEKVWIIPTRVGFVPMKMNKRCTMEIYIYRRNLDYTNVRMICTYEDE